MTEPDYAKLLRCNGSNLEVHEEGAGDPLLLICGTSQDHRLWAPLQPALGERYRVITYNHRGIGASERGSNPISMADLADDAAALLHELGIARAHVLGWSLGSTVAQELALRNPEVVASLTLAATWARTSAFQTSVFTALAHPWRTGDRGDALTALGIAYSPELLDTPQFGELMQSLEPLFPSTEKAMATVAAQWDADIAHDALDRLPGIAAPTLVVAGEQDLLTPPGLGRIVAEQIPGAHYELLTGAGSSHALLMERTPEFTDLVLGHLARNQTTSAAV